ncbi:MAG: pyridoxal-phosphate dependent enzyme [Haloferacaceae archaeon]
METTRAFRGLECAACGTDAGDAAGRCPSCGGPLDPAYDRDAIDAAFGPDGSASMWRFGAALPAADPVTAAEGATPLVGAPALADDLGVGRVLVKDEGRNPTGSFVDRGMALAVTAAVGTDREPLALAAAGAAGHSAAAYAGRAGLRVRVFLPSRAPFSAKAMVNVHGGDMRVVGGRYADAAAALDEELAADGYPLGAFDSPYRHEGAKTVAYEVAAARGWTPPDAVVVPVGTGEALVGIEKGFRELVALDLIDAVPRLVAVQAAGCAPIVRAHDRGADGVDPVEHPDTIAGELEVPDPPGGALALRALDRAGGDAVAVGDDDLLEGAVATAAETGVGVGPAGGAAAAAAWDLADSFGAGSEIVLLNPATGLKAPDVLRSHLMGQGV